MNNAQGFKTLRCGLISATALAGGVLAAVPTLGWAQAASVQTVSTQTADYNIAPQGLTGALRQFAEASKLQLAYDTKLTAEKSSPGVTGRMSAEAALGRLLAGSGLGFQMSPTGVVIAPATGKGAVMLAPVKAEGFADLPGATVVNGINGSKDAEATEGSGSYTTGAMSIASKTPLSIKETPAAVSVLTSQRIADQNIQTLRGALEQLPGVTVTTNGNTQDITILSRGFQINSFEVDGGAPIRTTTLKPQINLAEYDSVQLIRGADGLMNGYGDPSGVINLVRKKPLDHFQIAYEQDIASYNNFREVADITGPIAFGGKLRGRLVATEQTNDFYYKVAHNQNSLIYGILEYDLTPKTLLTVGGSFSHTAAIPGTGVPRYDTGQSLGLSTSTCLCSTYDRYKVDTYEAFLKIEHTFSENWSTKLNATYTEQKFYGKSAAFSGPIFTQSLKGEIVAAADLVAPDHQLSLDYTLNGGFKFNGLLQSFVLGGNYSHDNSDHTILYLADTLANGASSGVVDIFNFDPYAKLYDITRNPGTNLDSTVLRSTIVAAYINIRLEPIKGLHVLIGERYSKFDGKNVQVFNLAAFNIHSPNFGKPTKDHSSLTNYSLTYDLTKNITTYATYAPIYRPQLAAVENVGGNVQLFNAAPPVTGYNSEAGIKWQSTNNKFNASLSVYSTQQNNFRNPLTTADGKTQRDSNGNNIFSTNLQNIDSKGFDIDTAGELLPGWQVSGSYTYNYNHNMTVKPATSTVASTETIAQLASYAPRNLVKLWTTYHVQSTNWMNRIALGGGVQYFSRTYNVGTACGAAGPASNLKPSTCKNPLQPYNLPYVFETKPYAILALQAQFRVNDHIDLSFTANNVTGTKGYAANQLESSSAENFYLAPTNYLLALKAKW